MSARLYAGGQFAGSASGTDAAATPFTFTSSTGQINKLTPPPGTKWNIATLQAQAILTIASPIDTITITNVSLTVFASGSPVGATELQLIASNPIPVPPDAKSYEYTGTLSLPSPVTVYGGDSLTAQVTVTMTSSGAGNTINGTLTGSLTIYGTRE